MVMSHDSNPLAPPDETSAERALRKSVERLRVLAETSKEFAATTNVRELLDVIARRLSEVLGELCAIRIVAKDRESLEPIGAAYHPNPDIVEAAREMDRTVVQRMGEGLTGTVAATGVSILMPVVDTAQLVTKTPPKYQAWVAQLGITSLLVVPLKSRSRVLGVINLTRSDPSNPYTEDDQRLAEDLADRAALAMENALLLNELEERVRERTAALEASNAELEAFSYSVAHDLRAPLRGINSFSGALIEDYGDKLDDGARGYLNRVIANAVSMEGLIDALLALSRLTRTQLRCAPVDLASSARAIVNQLRETDPVRVVELVTPEHLPAYGDPALLQSILENLLANAWKFTREQPSARIELGGTAADGSYFVRDNGAGFNMAYVSKLFTPFQRLHSVKQFEGTGVGLAMVSRIVRRHGGRIWAEGVEGAGATFNFTLPERAGA
jgi:signal transduction histidine kinase